jgi:predicted ATP-dependent endonuclease of OLD family
MRVTAFRVQNYKKIRDTGWINAHGLTAFVGKNEAGKSAIFRGLSKLNPADGEKYDALKELPRSRFTDEFYKQDWQVASVKFSLNSGEREELLKLCPLLSNIETVECTRCYSWNLIIEFEPAPKLPDINRSALLPLLKTSIEKVRELIAPEGKGEELKTVKESLLTQMTSQETTLKGRAQKENVPKPEIDAIINVISSHSNEQWQKDLLQDILADFRIFSEQIQNLAQMHQAEEWVSKNIPYFLYFDRYDILDSAIHIPSFIRELNSQTKSPKHRVTHCLFKHVNLDIEKLRQLASSGRDQDFSAEIQRQVDERQILLASAAIAMTNKFSDWWEQRKHKFQYRADGNYFRVWVSDDLDPSEIELDQRSAGLQYFFSFYLVFLVEAEGAHRNCILLLDEPGLHVHASAQAKVVEFLEKLSRDNQTLYSTHSPFMIDGNHLERARAVYEAEDGTTKVSEDVWPRDKDTLFPLQAALGYSIAQTLFISKQQVIVEGLTDYWVFKSINEVLGIKNRKMLHPEIALVPAGGIERLMPLASLLMGHNVEIAVLLDGDEPGRRAGKKVKEELLCGKENHCIFIGNVTGNADAELEDIFPEDYYLETVKQAYAGLEISFSAEEKRIAKLAKRVEAFFQRNDLGKFEKWRPARVILDRIGKDPDTVPISTLEHVEAIFNRLNAVFGH